MAKNKKYKIVMVNDSKATSEGAAVIESVKMIVSAVSEEEAKKTATDIATDIFHLSLTPAVCYEVIQEEPCFPLYFDR